MGVLALQDVHVDIAGFSILRGVDLEVPSGSIVGLIGRNGAGKTTTIRSIMGLQSIVGGAIALDGVDLARLPAHERARKGIGYMPEDRRLIPSLTVEQNIMVPAWAQGIADAPARLDAIYAMMPEVREMSTRTATQCSGGQQKLVALARCFMAGSRLLLLDEPFEGVAPALSRRLVRAVQDLAASRPELSVLVCESDFKWARSLTDQIYLIERGETRRESGIMESA